MPYWNWPSNWEASNISFPEDSCLMKSYIEYILEETEDVPAFQNLQFVLADSYTGMLKEINRTTSSFAVGFGDYTVTEARTPLVDFSYPIMEVGILPLVLKQGSREVEYFAFMTPLASEVWVMILGAIVLSAILFFIFEGRQETHTQDFKRNCKSGIGGAMWCVLRLFKLVHVFEVPT